MKHVFMLIIFAIVSAILIGSLLLYFFNVTPSNIVRPCPQSYDVGHYSMYAGGSSTYCQFIISRGGNFTGAFNANATLFFIIQQANDFVQNIAGSIPTTFYYGLNTTGTNLNVSLPSGSYYIEFYFTYSYTGPSSINGTGYYGYTGLNITQTFIVKLQ